MSRFVFLTLISSAVVAIGASPAHAACFPNGQLSNQSFVASTGPYYGLMLGMGVAADVVKYLHSIDPQCGSGEVQSNHFTFNWLGNYLEIGYRERPDHNLAVFVEVLACGVVTVNNTWGVGQQYPAACDNSTADGGIFSFLIRSESPTYWIVFLDCHDGFGWKNLESFANIGNFPNGIPRSEFESFSLLNTVYSVRQNLNFRDLNFAWRPWPGIVCTGAAQRTYSTPQIASNTQYNVTGYDNGIYCLNI